MAVRLRCNASHGRPVRVACTAFSRPYWSLPGPSMLRGNRSVCLFCDTGAHDSPKYNPRDNGGPAEVGSDLPGGDGTRAAADAALRRDGARRRSLPQAPTMATEAHLKRAFSPPQQPAVANSP